AVIVHLLQMLARPDLTSPEAKLDFYYKRGKKVYYKTFSSNEGAPSYLDGLSKILKDFNANKNLKELMQIIDSRFHTDMVVDEDFAIFLQENKEWIAKSNLTQKLYLRAEETLKMGETLPR